MDSEEKWWEPSDAELEDMIEDRLEDGPLPSEATETTSRKLKISSNIPPISRGKALTISSGGLLLGLISPWGFWYESGFQTLRWSISDLTFIFTEGLNYYSEWGMTPLGYIEWTMFPMLSLVFVTTFVATWYKSRQGDEEFGRKASIFHLSFFGVWYLLSIINQIINYGYVGGIWLPTEWDYGIFIAAASGIGLHPTAYGLVEKFSNSY